MSPGYTLSTTKVECGTSGAYPANLVPGQSITAGGGTAKQWFNTAAYTAPAAPTTVGSTTYCNSFGNAPRNSIEGPGIVTNNMALSKSVSMGDTRSLEFRATISNVFNTVQYSGVNTTYGSPTFGQVVRWARCVRSSSCRNSDSDDRRSLHGRFLFKQVED